MKTKEYLSILKQEIHSTVFATVDENCLPVTRVIDIMLVDENSLYFITARGKLFYQQLTAQPFLAVSGMTGGSFYLGKKQPNNLPEAAGGCQIMENCQGCGTCVSKCPQQCIDSGSRPFKIIQQNCLHCGNCLVVCPFGAVRKR